MGLLVVRAAPVLSFVEHWRYANPTLTYLPLTPKILSKFRIVYTAVSVLRTICHGVKRSVQMFVRSRNTAVGMMLITQSLIEPGKPKNAWRARVAANDSP
jgi:hypothetical protein